MTDRHDETAQLKTAHLRRPVSGVILIGMSIAIWWPAFTLGAWETLFFDQLLTIWVASTAAFVFVVTQPRGARHRVLRALVLLVPSLWLVLTFLLNEEEGNVLTLIVDLLAIAIGLLGIPFTMWVLARIVWPEFGSGISKRNLTIAVTAIIGIAIGSFLLGANQEHFLTCEDFVISGNSEPPGCVHELPSQE